MVWPFSKSNNYPIQYIAISAGYDNKDQDEADKEALMKIFEDKLNQRKNQSVVLPRSRDPLTGIDDLKFMYCLLPGLPVVAFTLVNAQVPFVTNGIIGNKDIGDITKAVNESIQQRNGLEEMIQPTMFIKEKTSATITDNWRDIFYGMNIPEKTPLLWTAADIPFAYNVYWSLLDADAKKADLILDLNAQENMVKLFARNYYTLIKRKNGNQEELLHIKEPNRYIFTKKALDTLLEKEIITLFYQNRRGGQQERAIKDKAVKRYFLKQFMLHPLTMGVAIKAKKYLQAKNEEEKAKHALSEDEISTFGSLLLNDLFNSVKVRVKARHKDPFVVRDIDGLHDFAYYAAVLETVYKEKKDLRALEEIYPYASRLATIKETIEGYHLPLVENFQAFLNQKIERLNRKIKHFGEYCQDKIEELWEKKKKHMKRSDFDFYIKQMEASQIPLPYDAQGKINRTLLGENPHEVEAMIAKTIAYLKKGNEAQKLFQRESYYERWENDKKHYERLFSQGQK